MADAPTSNKGKRARALYDRARALGVVGGFVGIGVAAWTAIDEGGGSIGGIDLFDREIFLSLMAMAWALVGLLGAIMRWPSVWVPGMVMIAGGAIGYVSLPDRFLIPGALLVIAGGATVVIAILSARGDGGEHPSEDGRS